MIAVYGKESEHGFVETTGRFKYDSAFNSNNFRTRERLGTINITRYLECFDCLSENCSSDDSDDSGYELLEVHATRYWNIANLTEGLTSLSPSSIFRTMNNFTSDEVLKPTTASSVVCKCPSELLEYKTVKVWQESVREKKPRMGKNGLLLEGSAGSAVNGVSMTW